MCNNTRSLSTLEVEQFLYEILFMHFKGLQRVQVLLPFNIRSRYRNIFLSFFFLFFLFCISLPNSARLICFHRKRVSHLRTIFSVGLSSMLFLSFFGREGGIGKEERVGNVYVNMSVVWPFASISMSTWLFHRSPSVLFIWSALFGSDVFLLLIHILFFVHNSTEKPYWEPN